MNELPNSPIEYLKNKEKNIEQSAEEISGEKVSILLDSNFTDFGVRFVSIDEYKEILNNHRLPIGDLNAFKRKSPHPVFFEKNQESPQQRYSFTSFLEICVNVGWEKIINRMTGWERATLGIKAEQILIKLLKEAHHDEIKTGTTNLRMRVFENFRQKLLNLPKEQRVVREKDGWWGDMDPLQLIDYVSQDYEKDRSEFENIKTRIEGVCGKDADYILEHTSPQRHDVAFEEWKSIGFSYRDYPSNKEYEKYGYEEAEKRHQEAKNKGEIPDLNSFLSGTTELPILLKKFAQLKFKFYFFGEQPILERVYKFIFSQLPPDKEEFRENIRIFTEAAEFQHKTNFRLYHSALIFDLRQSKRPGHSGWTDLYQELGSVPEEKGGKLLIGAIALNSDKQFCRKMILLSSQSRDWSVPVFENSGNLRFPVQKGKTEKFSFP